ncbi:hypothetical protein ACJMK2_018505 [Sinanodonta woodiana]|uniref:TIR domain-containing protein n=1 Tax=Sinanodonta woodiana TaxID=1069815 RepID=A0ABD3UF59_SINWO
MRFRYTYCLAVAVAVVILMGKHSGAICRPSCSCTNITNDSTICNITYNITTRPLNWQDFFEYEVETIKKLDLIFKNGFQSQMFPLQEFFQFNWYSLQELKLRNLQADDTVNPIFEMAYLEKLPKLTKLVLRLGPMNIVAGNLQSPLHLSYLDVSDNGYLTFDNLAEIIDISGNELEELYANNINNMHKAYLDDSFFKSFEKTNITIIHIKNANIKTINSPNIGNFIPLVEEVDISQNNVDIFKSTNSGSRKMRKLKIFKGANVFVVAYKTDTCENFILEEKMEAGFCGLNDFIEKYPLFSSLEVLSIAGNEPCNQIVCLHVKCTLPETMPLIELRLSNSCFKIFDVEIKGLHKVEIFDFSVNGCKYISPLAFSELMSLKTLLLNKNELSTMENMYPDEFRTLIWKNRNLTNLDLSSNGLVKLPSDFFEFNTELNNLTLSSNLLSYLPKGIFVSNIKLEILDVSYNLFSVTDWLSSNLVNLRVLNIRNNRITTLDSEARHLIDIRSFTTFLANNPLDCSCENNDLYVWLSNKKSPSLNITEVYCTQTGISLSSHMNRIDLFSNDCELKRYIGLLGLLSIPVIIAICGVFYYRHYQNILRLRRIRRQLKDFAKENVAPQQQFLLYLAYSFADSETVLKQIFPELEARLQRELKVADKLVCISDRDFDVGTSISDEIIRAVSSCRAVLFVISKEFASSHWCEFESEIAIYQQKPIIIVALEQIKIKSFPSSLRKVCYKWTRIEWSGNKDVNMLDDFWKKVTKAVIKCTDIKY